MTSADAGGAQGTPDGVVAVRDLVRRRVGRDVDTWDLALVQRSETWDQVRMRHLVDSLLAGYPIGAILLCRVRQPSRTIHVDDSGAREVRDADSQSWQLLDGQQRINALTSVFTAVGRYGTFFLHMTTERNPPGPINVRSTKDRALAHIAWRERALEPERTEADTAADTETAATPIDPLPERDRHLDLSRWFEWAEGDGGDRPRRVLTDLGDSKSATAILGEIDSNFAKDLPPAEASVAAQRLTRLLHAWIDPTIPVLHAEVESPFDVLEVFTRINLGGVQVGGTDVYLAAVKTFWNDAEAGLERVRHATGGLLDRIGCLQLVSRLAARGLGQGDVLPLAVDRLAGPRGAELIEAMRELTQENSAFVTALASFCAHVRQASRLGHGLSLVSTRVWDEVLGWAVTTRRHDVEWLNRNVPIVDSYLLGATLFRYPRVLGAKFQRAALIEACAAGVNGEPFPLRRIVEVARADNVDLRGTRDRVRSLASPEDRLWTADWNAGLLLSIAQQLPVDVRGIDYDHIFPAAQAGRMWALSEYGRRMHHPHRRFVNSVGNLWALDLGTNRALQDTPPNVKLERLLNSVGKNDPYVIWSRDRWSLTDEDVEGFIAVDRGLTEDAESIDRAMALFRDLVTRRANHLLDGALEKFPETKLFAADTEIPAADPSTVRRDELAAALGVTVPEAPLVIRAGETTTGPSAAQDLDLGPVWTSRQDHLRRIWDEATRRVTRLFDPRRRPVLPRQNRLYHFDYMRWIWLGNAYGQSHVCVGVAGAFSRMYDVDAPLWTRAAGDLDGIVELRDRLLGSDLRSRTFEEAESIWIGIVVDPDLADDAQIQQVSDQLVRIRGFLPTSE